MIKMIKWKPVKKEKKKPFPYIEQGKKAIEQTKQYVQDNLVEINDNNLVVIASWNNFSLAELRALWKQHLQQKS